MWIAKLLLMVLYNIQNDNYYTDNVGTTHCFGYEQSYISVLPKKKKPERDCKRKEIPSLPTL